MSKMYPKQRYRKAKGKIMDAVLLNKPLLLMWRRDYIYIAYSADKHIVTFNRKPSMDGWFKEGYIRWVQPVQALEFFETFWGDRIGR